MCTQTNVNKGKHMIGNRGDLHGLARNPNIVAQKTSYIDGVVEFVKLHMLSCPFYLGSN